MARKNKRAAKLELQQSTSEIVLPVVILLGFLLAGMWLVAKVIMPKINEDNIEQINIELAMWEESFIEAEKSKVGIVFDDITTSNTTYEILREACNKYVLDEADNIENTTVDVDTIVDEEQYVDGTIDNIMKNEGDLAETGPIYFQDKIMLRYINNNGDMKVITALLDDASTSAVKVVTKEELVGIEIKQSEDADGADGVSIDTQERDWITEDEYLSNLDSTIKQMLLAASTEEISEAEKEAVKYFTSEGNQLVFGNRNTIKLESNATIKTIYIGAGKSDLDKTYKDRIFTHFEITTRNQKAYVYLVLKLNSYYRIFDIDII